MSNRYEYLHYCEYRDTETGVIGDNFVDILNQQDAKIKELEDMVIDKQNKLYSRLDKIKELQEENQQLKQQLHSQPAEIVEKIRSKCCVEDKCKDGSFVLGINEKDLDTILKEYQK